MKRNRYTVLAAVFAAAWLMTGTSMAQTSQQNRQTVHPDPNASVGGSQSERTGESGTPMNPNSPFSGTVEKGQSKQGSNRGAAQSSQQDRQTIHPDPNASVGGSQSERTGESGTPMNPNSPFSGTVEKGQSNRGSDRGAAQTSKGRETINPSARSSVGGSQSQRTGESGTPMNPNSPFSGTVEMGRANSVSDVKDTQEALRDKGYDPGAVDGIMGARTREALKKYQRASGLSATGTLDQRTADKLGIKFGGASDRSSDIDTPQERSNSGSPSR